ncbi:MAG TPA: 50S ribosomal protein L9 [Alphaproteobacteria bacterium]|nr:50S ribosomal protein L9 [Alphaproteobacteria bacterium]
MPTQVILLERVEKLGAMGDVVAVKPGYARNYLLPQKKALRATKDNVAYFEAQKKHLEADNDKRRKGSEGLAKKLDGTRAALIRQASEGGQLYGSVTARDIATAVSAESGVDVTRQMVELNTNFKTLGLFPVTIALHPEVRVVVTINIARSVDEAEIQAKTGRALIAEERREEEDRQRQEAAAPAAESVLEDSVLAAQAQEAEEVAEKPKKSSRKKDKAQEE